MAGPPPISIKTGMTTRFNVVVNRDQQFKSADVCSSLQALTTVT
jgi:hypothetical protein